MLVTVDYRLRAARIATRQEIRNIPEHLRWTGWPEPTQGRVVLITIDDGPRKIFQKTIGPPTKNAYGLDTDVREHLYSRSIYSDEQRKRESWNNISAMFYSLSSLLRNVRLDAWDREQADNRAGNIRRHQAIGPPEDEDHSYWSCVQNTSKVVALSYNYERTLSESASIST